MTSRFSLLLGLFLLGPASVHAQQPAGEAGLDVHLEVQFVVDGVPEAVAADEPAALWPASVEFWPCRVDGPACAESEDRLEHTDDWIEHTDAWRQIDDIILFSEVRRDGEVVGRYRGERRAFAADPMALDASDVGLHLLLDEGPLEPGTYRVTLRAEVDGDSPVEVEPTEFHFEVSVYPPQQG